MNQELVYHRKTGLRVDHPLVDGIKDRRYPLSWLRCRIRDKKECTIGRYGLLLANGSIIPAHRLSWEEFSLGSPRKQLLRYTP